MLRSLARRIIDKALRDVRADLARRNAELAKLPEMMSAQERIVAKLDRLAELSERFVPHGAPTPPPSRPVPPFMHQHGDLGYLHEAPFTEWVVANNMLETPFRVIDVGVNGGLSIRWRHLGRTLHAHGFDPLEEVIAPLVAEGRPNCTYHAIALGDQDGEADFFVPEEKTASSLTPWRPSVYAMSETIWRGISTRKVPVRRLDSLLAEGVIGLADFIKIDVENHEPDVLRGAQTLLDTVLALEIESGLNLLPNTSPAETHLGALCRLLAPRGLLIYDIAFDRVPTITYDRAIHQRQVLSRTVSRPRMVNVLFLRRPTRESTSDEVLKTAIIAELYAMLDTAYDIISKSELACRVPADILL